jgi:uncharacterized damage-inducible protein DinB
MKIRTMGLQVLAASCLAGASLLAMGQGAGAAAVTPADAVNGQLRIIESEMMGAVKAMPAEKYGFAPSAAIFVPNQKTEFPSSIRTFAQQATHVAQANYFFFSTVSGMKPDADMAAIAKLTNKDEVVAALAASFAFGHKAIATLTPTNAFEVLKTPEPGVQTRLTLSTFAVAHAFDHYGQIVEYLRMNAVVPPASAQ